MENIIRTYVLLVKSSIIDLPPLITSQLGVEHWHAYLGDPTLADAILDRLIHNAYRLALKGDSVRKRLAPNLTVPAAIHP